MRDINDVLKDTNIKVENIDFYVKEEGAIVSTSFHGGKNSYKISPKAFGVKDKQLSEDSREFLKDYVRDGSVTFIPNKEYKELKSIESRVKKRVRELSIGYNNSFVPMNSINELVAYFEKAKDEFFDIRDRLVEDYSNMIQKFEKIVAQSIKDLDAHEAEEEYNRIMEQIPSKEDFKNSFNAEMFIYSFPTIEDISKLTEETKEFISKQQEETEKKIIFEATVNIMNEIASTLISILVSDKTKGRIHHKTLKGIDSASDRVREKNIFGNEKLERIRIEMVEMPRTDIDLISQEAERLLAEVYMYAKDLELEKELNLRECPLKPKELEMIYSLYN